MLAEKVVVVCVCVGKVGIGIGVHNCRLVYTSCIAVNRSCYVSIGGVLQQGCCQYIVLVIVHVCGGGGSAVL